MIQNDRMTLSGSHLNRSVAAILCIARKNDASSFVGGIDRYGRVVFVSNNQKLAQQAFTRDRADGDSEVLVLHASLGFLVLEDPIRRSASRERCNSVGCDCNNGNL